MKENIIKNRYGQEFDFEYVCDHMDIFITTHNPELESLSPQDYYDKYCELHIELWGKDFFVDTDMVIKNKYGGPVNYDDAVEYMDDDIREYLHHQLAPCSAQYFYDEYCKMHKEIQNEDFEDQYFTEEGHLIW